MINFLASTPGRVVRAAVGVVLLGLSFVVSGARSWMLRVFGAVFVAVGVFDVCLLAPLFGKPLRGKDLRAASH